MTWDKTGEKVSVVHHGQKMVGTIVSSRVKYGGEVQHTVRLHEPVQYRWRTEPTDVVLINENELTVGQ